jgi:hypothetical protein
MILPAGHARGSRQHPSNVPVSGYGSNRANYPAIHEMPGNSGDKDNQAIRAFGARHEFFLESGNFCMNNPEETGSLPGWRSAPEPLRRQSWKKGRNGTWRIGFKPVSEGGHLACRNVFPHNAKLEARTPSLPRWHGCPPFNRTQMLQEWAECPAS